MESVIEFLLFEHERLTSVLLIEIFVPKHKSFGQLCPCKDGHRSLEAASHELMLLLC